MIEKPGFAIVTTFCQITLDEDEHCGGSDG
jgi:hypothetical protein